VGGSAGWGLGRRRGAVAPPPPTPHPPTPNPQSPQDFLFNNRKIT